MALPVKTATHTAKQTTGDHRVLLTPAQIAAAQAKTAAQTSAQGVLNEFLGSFGLSSLGAWAWQTYTNAGGGDLGMKVVQAELPNQEAYKVRFPAIASRVKAGLSPITPAEYLSYEQTLREAFTAHGLALPTTGKGFSDIVTGLLNADKSVSEVVNQDIGTAFTRVMNAPVEVRQAAEKIWGVNGDSALASLFLSPDHSADQLEKMSQSMDIAGTAARYGVDLTKQRAGRLADLGADTQLSKFSDLGQLTHLFQANQGEDPTLTLAHQGVAAAFGEDATSQAEINRRLMARKAALSGSGGPTVTQKYSTTDQGLSGLGSGSGG